MRNIAIVWFRNDLRILDNEALTNACNSADCVIPVFVFDERIFGGKTKLHGFSKTGKFRTKFFIESVIDLRNNLIRQGSNLIVRFGKPEEIVAQIANETKASWVYCNREMTSEEIKVQDDLERNLWKMGRELVYSRGKMLYYTADLPFPVMHTPDIFSSFRKEVEKFVQVRFPLEVPKNLKYNIFKLDLDLGSIPSIEDFGFDNVCSKNEHITGGESQGLQQIQSYIWDKKLVKNYKDTRNELLGWDYSTKLSPWLAAGCVSPKFVYHEIKKFEKTYGDNESTYWVSFELLWRDFFRLMGKKYGDKIFKEDGLASKRQKYQNNPELFLAWANGRTGIPFVDANMRELKYTGFMSNRGRQNVASFLCKDLHISWLKGAEYFESMLTDYDPCSNYGNWNYVAGVGNDPRENRYFNVIGQGKRYDDKGDYIKEWIPELQNLPTEFIHTPWLMSTQEQAKYGVVLGVDYPQPIIDVNTMINMA